MRPAVVSGECRG